MNSGIREESSLYSSTPRTISTAKLEADFEKLQSKGLACCGICKVAVMFFIFSTLEKHSKATGI